MNRPIRRRTRAALSESDPGSTPQPRPMPQAGRSEAAETANAETPAADRGSAWMERFQGGEEEAFDRIVTEYQKSLYLFVLRTLRDHGRAEDLTQDVFVRVYNARDRYRPTARFRTWLFTIANRLILNELRARKRRRRVFVETAPRANDDGIPTNALETAEQTQEEAPGAQLERRELEDLIEELVSGLAPNQQIALRLHRTAEVSYQEIADILGVTLAAVKSLLVRARESLRQGLQGYLRGEQEKQEPGT